MIQASELHDLWAGKGTMVIIIKDLVIYNDGNQGVF